MCCLEPVVPQPVVQYRINVSSKGNNVQKVPCLEYPVLTRYSPLNAPYSNVRLQSSIAGTSGVFEG
jgi:hypothetical protein